MLRGPEKFDPPDHLNLYVVGVVLSDQFYCFFYFDDDKEDKQRSGTTYL